jgi:EmrB/QacA subfamily drug resistance transporter
LRHAHDHPNHKWWTLFAMCFALFMIMLDNTVVNVALPSIQRSLHPSPANLEWIVNAYVLSFAALILLGGKLGDRFGRKRFFVLGLVVFTASSAACALAQSDTQLIMFRAVQGVGAAMLNPLSLSILVAAFPRPQLPQAIGIWAGISALGLAVGPLLGGFLTEHVDWSAVFWINVPIGIIAAAACLWAVAESRDPNTRTLDVTGTVLITAGLFSLTWGLIKTTSHSWTSLYTLGFLAAAAALIAIFLWWEARQSDPMVPLGFFRSRVFSLGNTVVLLVGFAMFGVIYFITLYFQNIEGYTPLQAGVRTLPMTMVVMAVAPVAGRLNTRSGPRLLMSVGMTMLGAGLIGLSRLDTTSSYWYIWPFLLIMGAGIAMTMPSVSSAAMSAVDPSKAGIASGVVNSARQVGGALGIAVLGSVGATLASSQWQDTISGLPATLQARAGGLEQLVIGARASQIGQIAGGRAQDAAAAAFMHGFRGAMLVGAGLAFTAAIISFAGLRGTAAEHAPTPPQPDAAPAAVET